MVGAESIHDAGHRRTSIPHSMQMPDRHARTFVELRLHMRRSNRRKVMHDRDYVQ